MSKEDDRKAGFKRFQEYWVLPEQITWDVHTLVICLAWSIKIEDSRGRADAINEH